MTRLLNRSNIRVIQRGFCYGSVKYTSSDPSAVSVSPKGLLIAKKATTSPVTITATVVKSGKAKAGEMLPTKSTSFQVTVNAASAKPMEISTSALPSYVQAGKTFSASASLKNLPVGTDKNSVTWKYKKIKNADGTMIDNTTEESFSDVKGNKVKLSLPVDTYEVYPAIGNVTGTPKTISVYNVLASKISLIEPFDASFKDWAGKQGIAVNYNGGSFEIGIKATGLNGNKTVSADVDEIVWTSSNANIATAVDVPVNNTSSYAPYRKVQIKMNDNKYTGKVTLTGTLKNSNKKVKITLNVTPEN